MTYTPVAVRLMRNVSQFQSAIGLSNSFRQLGFHVSRLRTGTPPRLLKVTNLSLYFSENFTAFAPALGSSPYIMQ